MTGTRSNIPAGGGRPTLLVGSVPLESAEAVFSLAGGTLGERLAQIPDGETGDRKHWVNWQRGVMAATPFLEERETAGDYGQTTSTRFGVKGDLPDDAAFGILGYADAASASYATFRRMRDDGEIPATTRFQVSLPTPLAPLAQAIFPQDIQRLEPLYARAMEAEIGKILDAIPADDLAIQWDVAVEIAMLEGVTATPVPPMQAVVSRLATAASWIPAGVRLGYHFCYGDAGHKHFKEPEDTGLMVELANALFAATPRSIDWIHMPVPRSRDDDAYYAPLADLKLPADCTLFLGLIHRTDGLPGAKKRIEAAERAVPDFGVATECGWGRRPPETVADVMKLTAEVATIS